MKQKLYIIGMIALGLLFSHVAMSQEEVKVPFSAVKSSCYGEIDMSKAEFALSEVGEKCVKKEWLEKNKPEPKKSELPSDFPIEKLVEKEPSVADVVKVVDNPEELLNFMNRYFTIKFHPAHWVAYSPRKFLETRKGDCKDWAHFFAYILSKKGYKVKQLAYVQEFNWAAFSGHVIAVYWDKGKIYKFTVLGEGSDIYGPFEDINELIKVEKEDPNVQSIDLYATFPPDEASGLPYLKKEMAAWAKQNTPKQEEASFQVSNPKYENHLFNTRVVEIRNESYNPTYLAGVKLGAFKKHSIPAVIAKFNTTPRTDYYAVLVEGWDPVSTSRKKLDIKLGDRVEFEIKGQIISIRSQYIYEAVAVYKFFSSQQDRNKNLREN